MSQELFQTEIQDETQKIIEVLKTYGIHPRQFSDTHDPSLPYSPTQVLFNINQPDEKGFTALMHAVERSHADNVRLLLRNGANPHIRESNQRLTALTKAITMGDHAVTNILLQEPSIRNSPWILSNALCHAAREGQHDIANLLLSFYNAPSIPNAGEIPLMWAHNTYDDNLIKTFCDHLGTLEQTRKQNPELATYLDRCRLIKEYGEIFGLKAKIKVRYPNSNNYEHIETQGLFLLETIELMTDMITHYLNTASLHEKTKESFQNIQRAFIELKNHLRNLSLFHPQEEHDQVQNKDLLLLPFGWQNNDFYLAKLKDWLLICDGSQKITGHLIAIYPRVSPITKEFAGEIRTTKSQDNAKTLAPRILKIIDQSRSIASLQNFDVAPPKPGSVNSAKFFILALLFTQRLAEFQAILSGTDSKEISILGELGIRSLQDAKAAALAYAKREYRHFITDLRDAKLKQLIGLYQSPTKTIDDYKICRDLLGEILSHYGQILYSLASQTNVPESAKRTRRIMRRIELMINSLNEYDRLEIIESLKNDNVDLLYPFIREKDFNMIKILISSGASLGLTLRKAAAKNDLQGILDLSSFDLHHKIDEPNEEGDTALIIAARRGHYDIAKTLLEFGANPDIANRKTKETPKSITEKRSDSYLQQLFTQNIKFSLH